MKILKNSQFLTFGKTGAPALCRNEISYFINISKKYSDIQVIGISLDKSAVPVSEFINDKQVNYPIFMMNKDFFDFFGEINSSPTTFILNQHNKIINPSKGYRSQYYFVAFINQNSSNT